MKTFRLAGHIGSTVGLRKASSRGSKGRLKEQVKCISVIFLLGLPGAVIAAKLPEADALVEYADSLGRSGRAVIVGTEGLTIKGNILEGASVVRPSVALARAAELYAEGSMAENDTAMLSAALGIWRSLDDYQTPVPYLRLFAAEKKQQNPEFATFCTVVLAEIYTKQGDIASAEKLLQPFEEAKSSTRLIGFARASYAGYRLKAGDIETARRILDEVVANAPQTDFNAQYYDGYRLAVALQDQLPGAAIAGGAKTKNEAKLLKGIEGNPRQYEALAIVAYGSGDKQKAIEYWGEFRKRFPNELRARFGAVQCGKIYEELKEIDKAIEIYRGISIQYPDFLEGATASTRAAELLNQSGRSKDALDFLGEAAKRIKTAQGQALLLATQGQLYLQNRMSDEAAEKYMVLLIKYGDQDAARDAAASLRKLAPKIKNWRKFTQTIQNWLSGKYGHAAQLGNGQMNVSDVSQLPRLALGFYIEDGNASSGVAWLKVLGMQSDARDRDWFIRDEAWFYGEIAWRTRHRLSSSNRQELVSSVKLALRAWEIAPGSDEGFAGVRAAQSILLTGKLDKTTVKQFTKDLENFRKDGPEVQLVELLIPLYESVGDQKVADELRRLSAR